VLEFKLIDDKDMLPLKSFIDKLKAETKADEAKESAQ
jgi:hypothetical protein